MSGACLFPADVMKPEHLWACIFVCGWGGVWVGARETESERERAFVGVGESERKRRLFGETCEQTFWLCVDSTLFAFLIFDDGYGLTYAYFNRFLREAG